MTLPEAMSSVYSNYATGSGRASRSEYWWYFFANVLVYVTVWGGAFALLVATHATTDDNGITLTATGIVIIWLLLNAIPSIAVTVRRLHDVNMAGWLYLLHLVPLGDLALFVITLLPGTRGSNSYGVDPTRRNSSRGILGADAWSQGPIPQNAFAATRITPPDYVPPPMQGPPAYASPPPNPYPQQAPQPYAQQPPAPTYRPQPPAPPYVQQPPAYPQQPPAPPYVQQPPPYPQQPPAPPYVQQPPPYPQQPPAPPYAQQPPPPPYPQQPPPPPPRY